jgi:glycosyltransferase involved in cell wall biosynthesis
LKICFLGFEIVPRDGLTFYGGIANNVVRTSKGLAKLAMNEVHIITSDVNRILLGPIVTPWATIHPVSTYWALGSTLFGAEFLAKISAVMLTSYKSKFDLVHIHTSYPLLGLLADVPSLLMRVPTILTLYSPLQGKPSMKGDWFHRQLLNPSLSKLFLSSVNRIIAISRNVKESLVLYGLSEHCIEYIPPIVDTSLFRPDLQGQSKRSELSLEKDALVILYCGNWRPWKGVDLLVESMPKVVGEFPKAKLLLAFGEPIDWYLDYRSFLRRRIIELKMESHIIEMGLVQDINQLMAASDVVVAPFRNTREISDLPLSILEAMSCGKPVIATKVGGVPEIIRDGENGLVIQPDNRSELEENLCFLLGNQDVARKLGQNASDYVFQNFGSDSVIERITKIYKEAARS